MKDYTGWTEAEMWEEAERIAKKRKLIIFGSCFAILLIFIGTCTYTINKTEGGNIYDKIQVVDEERSPSGTGLYLYVKNISNETFGGQYFAIKLKFFDGTTTTTNGFISDNFAPGDVQKVLFTYSRGSILESWSLAK